MRGRSSPCGYTLVEVLIAIVILGILSGVVVLGLHAFTERSAVASCRASVNAVRKAALAYSSQHSAYPADFDSLTGSPRYLELGSASVSDGETSTPTLSGGNGSWSVTFSLSPSIEPTVTEATPSGCAP